MNASAASGMVEVMCIGGGRGRYRSRREFDKNNLKDTDTGAFSIAGSRPAGPGVGAPVNGGTAPVAISGVNWVVKQLDGEVEANLIFASPTTGSENDPDGDIDPFSYIYSTNGTTAILRVNFKPGKWDEYDLDFATGGYTRGISSGDSRAR